MLRAPVVVMGMLKLDSWLDDLWWVGDGRCVGNGGLMTEVSRPTSHPTRINPNKYNSTDQITASIEG